jgi:hypothetical protein
MVRGQQPLVLGQIVNVLRGDQILDVLRAEASPKRISVASTTSSLCNAEGSESFSETLSVKKRVFIVVLNYATEIQRGSLTTYIICD